MSGNEVLRVVLVAVLISWVVIIVVLISQTP